MNSHWQGGKAAALMCSYNAISGTPSCANSDLLQTRVRDLWHFSGYVVSDCDAVGDVAGGHHFAKDGAEASALAVKAMEGAAELKVRLKVDVGNSTTWGGAH